MNRLMYCYLAAASFLCGGISLADSFGSGVNTFNIDFVTIGNPGNVADAPFNGVRWGAVGYVYQIGKYEITAGQYTEFLNAVAKADVNGLYNTAMGNPYSPTCGANIQRIGSSPDYSYSVAPDWADRPVNYVSIWDATRFANWLHNGQPIGPQGLGTTEDGAYHNVGDLTQFGRNANAKFFIPNEDEWYKAAYHDKTAGLAASYFYYPTGHDTLPGNNINETTNAGNNANYNYGGPALGFPYQRTVVGEFELSVSPYGTFDQGGNVAEFNETKDGPNYFGIRGSAWLNDLVGLDKRDHYFISPTYEGSNVGFRIASLIPEPTTIVLVAFAAFACGCLRRRRS